MVKELSRMILFRAFVFILALQSGSGLAYAASSEEDHYKRMTRLFDSGRKSEFLVQYNDFIGKFPDSRKIADARFMRAGMEANRSEAIKQYRTIIDKYRYYPKRDLAQLRICEILYLNSSWDELIIEAQRALNLFPESAYSVNYKLNLAKAYVYCERYEDASAICRKIANSHHGYNDLSAMLLITAHIEKKTTGNSRAYLNILSEILTGFKDSDSAPGALYLLGKYYENKSEYNKAYSAYVDVTKKYSRSPEADFSKKRMAELNARGPVYVKYMPDVKQIQSGDTLDIKPEIDLNGAENNEEAEVSYSICLGPFFEAKKANEIKNLIQEDFSPVKLVRVSKRILLYVGLLDESESAVALKIRLAEEYGINGNIVRVKRDMNRQYIYGE